MNNQQGIAVIGSLNMDIVVQMPRLPKLGETISGDSVHYIPGGKGANQALGASRLTAVTRMIGCVGTDQFGHTIQEQLGRSGVNLDGLSALEGYTTGTAHISLTEGDNCIVVVPGANEACTDEYVRSRQGDITSSKVAIAQLEIPIQAVISAFQIAKEAGVTTVLNPAPARQLPDELFRLTDYITPNESEWELISGRPADSEESLQASMAEWEARHGTKIIITRGEKGCSYLEDGKLITIPAPRVEVVDTTGAGDAFNAALAYGLSQGQPIQDIVRLAVTSASLSVQTFGAQDGMPQLEDVLRVIA
ncbi:ribokinase [Paenibacillus sp. GCM10023252]|uniref:ribokinase n=1 Tax=Paenibacillus sp. GCM10023252 TaxID=3252649 RepID=UPI0036075E8E